jgi:DNA polymerase-1
MADAGKVTRTRLGEYGDKTYYWNVTTDSLEWSVPSPRDAVRAPAGYRILAADYSQIEVKIMAYASGDPVLIEAINSGQDVHSFNATKVFGTRYKFTYDELEECRLTHSGRYGELNGIRNNIKTVTFGVPYGAGPGRVALMTGMSLDEAKEFIDTFFGTFKVLKMWLDEQGIKAIEEGYSTTPVLGRKRFYVLPSISDPEAEQQLSQIKRWAGNMPIQGSNADILKIAMRLLYLALRGGNYTSKKLYDARFLLVVHDEIVMLCKIEDIPAVKQLMAQAMNQAYYEYTPRVGDPRHVFLGGLRDKVTGLVVDQGIHVVEADIWAKA